MTPAETRNLLYRLDRITDHIQSFIDDKSPRHIYKYRYIPDEGRGEVTKIIDREKFLELGLEAIVEDVESIYGELSEAVPNA